MIVVRAVMWLSVVLGLGVEMACLSPGQRREESLSRVSREFNDGLRWGRYDNVTSHLSPEDARLFFERVSYVGGELAMADSEITSVKLDDSAEHATVRAEVSWYNQRKALLRSATLEQDWQWSKGQWLCVRQIRVRGDRFPLVPEPLSAARDPAPVTP